MTNEARNSMYRQFKRAMGVSANLYSRIAVNQVHYGFGCSVKLYDASNENLIISNIKQSDLSNHFDISAKMHRGNSLLFKLQYKSHNEMIETKVQAPIKVRQYVNLAEKRQVRNDMRKFYRKLTNHILNLKPGTFSLCDVYPKGDNWLVIYYHCDMNNIATVEQNIQNSVLSGIADVTYAGDRLQLSIPNKHYSMLQQYMEQTFKLDRLPLTLKTIKQPNTRLSSGCSNLSKSDLVQTLMQSIDSGKIDANAFKDASSEIFNLLQDKHTIDDTVKLAGLMGKKIQISLV